MENMEKNPGLKNDEDERLNNPNLKGVTLDKINKDG